MTAAVHSRKCFTTRSSWSGPTTPPHARVFAAWESVEARLRWSVPYPEPPAQPTTRPSSGSAGSISCAAATRTTCAICAHVRYLEILPDVRIVMAESVAEDGIIRAVSLITIELSLRKGDAADRHDAGLGFRRPGMLEGYNEGWAAALDNLAKEF